MKFVHCPTIGTIEDHLFFNSPFISGVSLFRVRSEQISTFSATRAASHELDDADAAALLAGIADAATAELAAFRADLARRAEALKKLVADAQQLAELPADLTADRATVRAYIAEAEAIIAAPAPDVRAGENVARWGVRFEGNTAPTLAAVERFEGEIKKLAAVRDTAGKRRSELETALARMDSPEAAGRLASVRLQRDLTRRVPGLVTEFGDAQKAAAAALARMSTVAAALEGMLHGRA
ncbi:hypothetical protein FBZ83_11965 [Azospirillum brasilense]|uniref:Uncharacterized protein n=1 Tax=Azospirillum brasilense TaxID=192 RepID=A0A560BUX1_AZOBR|nr:hypothetical protein [Azospirillum brasilense]TWA76414.1 hypothetical protein FBZ83_11965 [Azospirillum brasilense]